VHRWLPGPGEHNLIVSGKPGTVRIPRSRRWQGDDRCQQPDPGSVRPGYAGHGDLDPYPVGGRGHLPRRRHAADLPPVRAAGDPAGGEIDHKNAESLALALAEAIRLAGDVTVNMSALAFIDVSRARLILDAARGACASRAVTLQCGDRIAARFALLGAADIPGLSVVDVDDR
jgi:hypothetical protein